jgi:glycerophosphoryl diester phosphodiesterase
VVIHDATLDRTTNAREKWKARRIRVSDRTSREIRTLDAGSWHDQAFAGARVPLLTEALDLILERGRLPLIERKAGDAETLVRLLRDCGFINRVVVISFDWLFLRRVHDLEPGQILGGLGPPTRVPGVRKPLTVSSRLGLPWLGVLAKTGCSIAVWNRPLSWTAVADAHRLGFKVWVYTVNKLRTSSRLLKAGVDGLITDDLAEIQNAVGAPDESG